MKTNFLLFLIVLALFVGCATPSYVPYARMVKKNDQGGIIALKVEHRDEDRAKASEMMKQGCGNKEVKIAEKDSERVKVEAEMIGEKCPECKTGDLVLRTGKFGKFISCNQFPECKYTR
ncbi:MAG: topoisomerase DNA-binding C4 zinc finger domain-containing protein, partial [Pseudomonadota bacterium]